MADQATQWLALEGELITAVEGVTPNKAATLPFVWRTLEEQESAADITSAAGATRLFEFTVPGPDVPNMTIGHTSRHKVLQFDLKIIYPGGPLWAAYAADDADKIAHTIRATAFSYADFVNPSLDEGGASLEPIVSEEGGTSGWVLTVPFFAPIQVS